MQADYSKLEAGRERILKTASRIVVKLGTSTVTAPDGTLCLERVQPLIQSVARLHDAGKQVVVVSSGAIGLGRGWLGLHRSRLEDLATKQACAAVGQSLLMNAYKEMFCPWNIKVAQVLLTGEDFSNWGRYTKLRRTMEKLLNLGVVPIVNENDTVSTAEIESLDAESRTAAFSDNDRLAALVMSGLDGDALILLTNVDGFLQKRPAGADEQTEASIVPLIEKVTPELKALASGPAAGGRGGMLTKLEAGEIAMNCGRIAVIANGTRPDILERIFSGEAVGTAFVHARRIRGKRRWIAYAAGVRGRVTVDAGARRAITQGKASLLTSGVERVDGTFSPMDVVSIVDSKGKEIARGIVTCASDKAEEMLKRKGALSNKMRQSSSPHILVRRDNIVLLERT
ncbi:MAG TPA: glutamate 5-kinase [Candidatus Acidoferrum sp.]|nr:glutamate 5-kinase [Candidatus Acidoferrum sp.]